MANRVVPTSLDADNSAGSCTLAACTDWRSRVRRFHVGTGPHEPASDAGYTTAGSPFLPQLSINLLPYGGVHIEGLGLRLSARRWLILVGTANVQDCQGDLQDDERIGTVMPTPDYPKNIA